MVRSSPEPVDDPFYIIQGLYNGPDAYASGNSFGYEEEDVAIAEAKKLARDPTFEGDYVRVITRDGELVWDSRKQGVREASRRPPVETMQSLAWEADDIVNQLGRPPNAIGILRRVRDSEFYRQAPVGSAPDLLSREELKGWIARWKGELRAKQSRGERRPSAAESGGRPKAERSVRRRR